ncbi:DUF6428 family protein [Myroides phaeus]|uniref:Uncharacterized protein n=1 Tax=Myroides phaeus TaxID=702745 RepID=A0A1G8F9V0_9FLAO|nr:DUF6428 family protein [Myroides phaeus]MEC4116843.1 DUF6428 family protein [Myroides phaeus]SDH78887.1 hypothetical protein SAMN05421818_11539 [Myroides phaeus]
MKLSEVKAALESLEKVDFQFEDGSFVPAHFHVTEVGQVDKKYIDCGGVIRREIKVSFQLWNANDFEHRLKARKLLNIIRLSENKLGIEDAEVEVEYQGAATIGKYTLDFNGTHFVLINTLTACLAEDACGITPEQVADNKSECSPGSGCC